MASPSSYTGFVDHTGDVPFRAWGLGFSSNLTTIGLVNTADTGTINWVTVARPGTNTVAGKEMWRTSDSTVFYLIEYGTGASTTTPQMWVTVGQGTNGALVLTGTLSTRNTFTFQSTPTSTTTLYTTYMSASNDHLTIIFAQNGGASSTCSIGMLQVHKLVDGTGAATTQGIQIVRHDTGGAWKAQTVRWQAPAKAYSESPSFCFVPGNPTVSEPAGTNQTWPVFANDPRMRVNPGVLIYIMAETAENTTFTDTPVGTASHTYIAYGQGASNLSPVLNSNATAYAMALRYD